MENIDIIEIEVPSVTDIDAIEIIVNQGIKGDKGDAGGVDPALIQSLEEINDTIDLSLVYQNVRI